MTTETLEKAKKIDDEIRSLTLASISDAHNIIPACVTYRFIRKDYDGGNEQCTTEISLSDEMRQIIRQAIEDRVKDLKKQLAEL